MLVDSPGNRENDKGGGEEISGEGAPILIVDDEPVLRRVLRVQLSREGYQCQEAGNADEALSSLESRPADLVILDVMMPGKSGAELLPEIKALYPDTAVIMATAVQDAVTAISCMKEGAYDYLIKPFNLDEVVYGVQRALERTRLEMENREYRHTIERQLAALNKLFQDHLNVRQRTEDIYGHLVGEMAKLSDELQTLVGEAQTQLEKLKEPPVERG